MKRVRIIPVLLIEGNGLYKTVKFSKPNYIGDPVNAVKIFNDKEVDEILVLDIGASAKNKEPNFDLLRDMCGEAFMPLGYGGGVTRLEHAHKLFKAGVEKVVINSVLLKDSSLITDIASHYGAQSTVVCIDYKKGLFGGYKPGFLSGSKTRSESVIEYAKACEKAGAGEIILQSIDRDGTFSGLDMEMIRQVSGAVSVPVVACGGLNSLGNAQEAVLAGASAIAGGSFFVYKNNDPRSILINYPGEAELKEQVFSKL